MALRLITHDDQGREVGLVLLSAYAPIGAADEEEWINFLADLDIALQICKTNDAIIFGIDGNASIGKGDGIVCGPHG
eukprot:5834255-Ditylum_brightwellii.AAC.1